MKNNKLKSVFPEEPILPRGGMKVYAYLQILSKAERNPIGFRRWDE